MSIPGDSEGQRICDGLVMRHKAMIKHRLEVQNVVNYYFCDVCHYCFEAESLPDRCPDCGKTVYQNRPAIRLATEKEVQDLLRARDEE